MSTVSVMSRLLFVSGLLLWAASFVTLAVVAWRRGRRARAQARTEPAPAAAGRPAWAPPDVVLRQVHDSDIEASIRTGALADAVMLYREKTGADPAEARHAVEAWRDRLRAS